MINNLNDNRLNILERILNKLYADTYIKYDGTKIMISSDIILTDIDLLKDIITLADQINKNIIITIESFQINLNLEELLHEAIINKKNDIIYFLAKKINIYEIEPKIMEMAITFDNDELTLYLIESSHSCRMFDTHEESSHSCRMFDAHEESSHSFRMIDTHEESAHSKQMLDVYENDNILINKNYIYQIASKGKLDILIKIIQNYFDKLHIHNTCENIHEDYLKYCEQCFKFNCTSQTIHNDIFIIVTNISIQAIINNHLNILEYFCPKESFSSIPDIILIYFFKAIEYGHLPIIKYFVENGTNIKHEKYKAIDIALKHKKYDIIKYFYTIEPSIINMLDNNIISLIHD